MHSPLINMEMQGWRMDSVVSLGMACAFLLPICIPFAWFKNLVPYLDQIITVVLSLIMIPTPIRTVITGIRDLMLIPPEEYRKKGYKVWCVGDDKMCIRDRYSSEPGYLLPGQRGV